MTKGDIDFKKVPDGPGVYYFRNSAGILYIGKATSLRDRVKSYFAADIAEVRSPLIAKVVQDATRLTWEETDSVLEALILEAKRVKEHRPVGNTDLKDDKSYAYLAVTKEAYPRFLIVRGRELQSKAPVSSLQALYGPFLSAASLRDALKIIRKIFPFFDTPFPIDGHLSPQQEKMIHFNQAIGLYPKDIDKTSYLKNVRNIKLLFEAKKTSLLKRLEREMHQAAKKERFEDAAILRRQVFSLKHIQDITLVREELREPSSATYRIEAYDTAHTRGESPRGVMAVVTNGEVEKNEYRIFTIQTAAAGDDYQALEEILRRRFKHREWMYPQLIVIDGGKAHLTRAKKVLNALKSDADIVAVVKDERHRPKQILGNAQIAIAHEKSILLANAEAHRFSIGRHRLALRRSRNPKL